MKPLVWVRLLFRAMGVLFIGLALPQCLQLFSQLVSFAGSAQMRATWGADWWQMFYTLGWGGGGLLQLGFGVYLLLGGKRLREWCMRDVEGRCPRCDYELAPASTICAECGLPLREPGASSSDVPPRQETQ